MYCRNCGKEVEDKVNPCPFCGIGRGLGGCPSEQPVVYIEKSPGLAMALGFALLGSGQIYVGRVGRGISFMIAGIVLFSVAAIYPFMILASGKASINTLVGCIVLILLVLAYYFYVLYDAYSLAKKYNEHLRIDGFPPW